MGTHTVHRTGVAETRAGSDLGRLLLTLVGGAALIVAAFLHWTRNLAGDNLSNRALVKIEFATQTDIVKTMGGISILLGLVALVGLVDRTGWLTRLAGAFSIVMFVLFAIEVYRSTHHQVQVGAWLALAAGVVLVFGGTFGGREIVEVPTVVEKPASGPEPVEAGPAETGPVSKSSQEL
jgi:hypothetical protein